MPDGKKAIQIDGHTFEVTDRGVEARLRPPRRLRHRLVQNRRLWSFVVDCDPAAGASRYDVRTDHQGHYITSVRRDQGVVFEA